MTVPLQTIRVNLSDFAVAKPETASATSNDAADPKRLKGA